jgi:hypothetical protein
MQGSRNMKRLGAVIAAAFTVASPLVALSQMAVGAAPTGDATQVAARIIKYNFPTCKQVSGAWRMHDGAIAATCDGILYLVFTMFDAKQGKTIELALNCAAAKAINVSCYK